ncbi:helix-turn-helix transcriptional regulator [Paenibacillus spongiae]|uniref:Helix-turn-helix transcriptional regulator n=1 Tax=Paenibacillus spongiae TaxID=2909671 RepID=A0ABY5S7N8_9BACL|nr:response regulator transcription factor [Paenibacillus spongiae]UVI29719.1 helix-turn-helix transcriptional regulator [Paenibacillus spongiae]
MHIWEIDEAEPFAFRCVFFEWSYRPKSGVRFPNDFLSEHPEECNRNWLDEPHEMGLPEWLMVDSFSFWKGLFEAVTTEYIVLSHQDYPESLAINGHFQLLLHHVYRLVHRQTDYMDPRIAKLMASMEQQAGGSYGNVDSWAEKLGLSRSHFHTLFRVQTGFTPKRYWNRCRIKKAQNDLHRTNDSVTMIAERYGFSSIHVFTKVFHQMIGITPTDYRSQSRLL